MKVDLEKYKAVPQELPMRSMGGETVTNQAKLLEVLVERLKGHELVHWYSDGDWSMHQLLQTLLAYSGPADVLISSYAFSETPTRIIANLKEQGMIRTLCCLIDSRVETRTAGSLQLLKGISDRLALIQTHAKVTLLRGDDLWLTVVGSANYTENRRYEAGIVTKDKMTFQFHETWFKKELYGSE